MRNESINTPLILTDRPRSYNRWLLAVVVLLLASTIVFGVLFGLEKSKTDTDNDDLCLTPYCIRAANYLLDSIDETVKPCEDFYHFTCGTWLKTTRIPDDASEENRIRILNRRLIENVVDLLSTTPANETNPPQCVVNARRLYSSCIDDVQIETDGVQPVLSLIETEFGGWPILHGSSWTPASYNISNLLLKLRQYNYNAVFRINSEIDDRNSSAHVIVVNQGLLGLPERQYFASETNITIAYRQFIGALATALANGTTNDSMIDQDVQDMFNFEKHISQYYWTNDERLARDNETIRTTVSQLSQTFKTSFDFTNLLRLAYGSANVILADTDTVTVSELGFLTNVSAIMDTTSPRTLQNYFVWHFMMDQAGNMPRTYRVIKEQFEQVFDDAHSGPPRTVRCGAYVNRNMGLAVSKLYIKSYFDDDARNQTAEMVGNIQNSFVSMIEQSNWMDDPSQDWSKDKAKAITQQIGYPDYLASDNNTQIEQDYADYVFNSTYIANVFKIHQIQGAKNFQLLRKSVDHSAWGSLPPTVIGAFYQPSLNQISVPAGIIQLPFFNKEAPKYLNYGGIGTVIGHEIVLGFDGVGRQFDKDGNRGHWWSQPTIDTFNDRKQCIINQYNNFTVPQINMNCDGKQTQDEDIADNGAIKAAFFAYQQWAQANPNADKKLPGLKKYTAEQLFFINYAHTWCIKMTDAYALNHILINHYSLGPFRVLGPTSNFDGFSKAFGCKAGQKNSPTNKCTVW